MNRLRERLMKGGARAIQETRHFAVPREAARLSIALLRHGVIGLTARVGQAAAHSSALDGTLSEARFFEILGDQVLTLFDSLGPIYGKAGQIILSRLSPPAHEIASVLGLTRLYKDWPALPFSEIEVLLDREIPHWRTELRVEAHPLGVASMAQVHAAKDKDGREWVIKVIKPQARARLGESVAAMEALCDYLAPLALTLTTRRVLKELRELCVGFRQELDLGRERATIERVHAKLFKKRQKTLVIPAVNAAFCTPDVLCVERFQGVSLAAVVAGDAALPAGARQKLARSMLSELLVQVFELGLFHADPHAGNLILLDSGAVGLFDWGLAGELTESDRRHIAAILKAVLALDIEKLVDALQEMGPGVAREAIKKELGAVVKLMKRGEQDPEQKATMQQLFEACLKGASRLGIVVPDGLLMMVKSLVTIEGLARGIDPKVSMARVATPVLFRAAKPGVKDVLALGKRLPALARQFLNK